MTQVGYVRAIFDEAAASGAFDRGFLEKRLCVGHVHNVIDLPMKWHVGSHVTYELLVRKHLARSFFWNPWLRSKGEQAICQVFNYDLQAVAEAFFKDIWE